MLGIQYGNFEQSSKLLYKHAFSKIWTVGGDENYGGFVKNWLGIG
jgi:hypothetical protein